jgi:hypothetical protein
MKNIFFHLKSLASAIIQLYLSNVPSNIEWRKESTGIVCFVRDNDRQSYFFQLFNFQVYILKFKYFGLCNQNFCFLFSQN